jgi:hypothetical protein
MLEAFANTIAIAITPPKTCKACKPTIIYRKEKDTFLVNVIPLFHN